MKFFKEIKRRFNITVEGFKMLFYSYFTEEGQSKLLDYAVMLHGGKRYILFDFPIIAGGKLYSSIDELYKEDRAKKEKKVKSYDKKGRDSKKAGKKA